MRLAALLLLAHPLRAAWQPALQAATSHARSRSAARYGKPVLLFSPFQPRERIATDWSFLDATYVITCPAADGSNPRLDGARRALAEVGLDDWEPREFEPDDEDRVRGCYTSHIAVLEEAERRFAGKEDVNVLVIEDNLSLSTRLCGSTLEAVRTFLRRWHTPGRHHPPRMAIRRTRCLAARRLSANNGVTPKVPSSAPADGAMSEIQQWRRDRALRSGAAPLCSPARGSRANAARRANATRLEGG